MGRPVSKQTNNGRQHDQSKVLRVDFGWQRFGKSLAIAPSLWLMKFALQRLKN